METEAQLNKKLQLNGRAPREKNEPEGRTERKERGGWRQRERLSCLRARVDGERSPEGEAGQDVSVKQSLFHRSLPRPLLLSFPKEEREEGKEERKKKKRWFS